MNAWSKPMVKDTTKSACNGALQCEEVIVAEKSAAPANVHKLGPVSF
jgi:hypothetical protein